MLVVIFKIKHMQNQSGWTSLGVVVLSLATFKYLSMVGYLENGQISILSLGEHTSFLSNHTPHQIKELESQTAYLNKQTEELNRNTEHLKKQTEELDKQTKYLDKQTEELNRQNKYLDKQTEELNNLDKQIGELNKQNERLAKPIEELNKKTVNLAKLTKPSSTSLNKAIRLISVLEKQVYKRVNEYRAFRHLPLLVFDPHISKPQSGDG